MTLLKNNPTEYPDAIMHLTPKQAWDFLQNNPQTVFIDIRMEIEAMYVGHPPKSVNIPWYEYPNFEIDIEEFTAAINNEVKDKNQPIILICRSGARTLEAAKVLINKGFTKIINVLHGFEGDIDHNGHRSTINGWRFDGLPWRQI